MAAAPLVRCWRKPIWHLQADAIVSAGGAGGKRLSGLGLDGSAPSGRFLWSVVTHRERAYRVAHDADLVRIRDTNRSTKQALLRNPGQSGHFAVAVEREGAGKRVIGPRLGPTWSDRRNSCAHDVGHIAYQREVADRDTCNIGDGVELPRRQAADRESEPAQSYAPHAATPHAVLSEYPGIECSRDPAEDFDYRALPESHSLRRHVLYRLSSGSFFGVC